LHRFEAVADVGKGAGDNGREGVGEIAGFYFFMKDGLRNRHGQRCLQYVNGDFLAFCRRLVAPGVLSVKAGLSEIPARSGRRRAELPPRKGPSLHLSVVEVIMPVTGEIEEHKRTHFPSYSK
jgi:hypothetical protein